MSREKITKFDRSIMFNFIKGDARYEQTYMYGGAQKLFFHDFIIERDGKRYCLSYIPPSDPKFYTETYSEKQKEWISSEKVKCQFSNLPYNIRHTIKIDQGTLSRYE